MSTIRRVPLPTTYNTRDIGGYFTNSNHQTKWVLILRSDVPTSLSKKAIILLENYRLNLVVDLRSPNQAMEKPSAFQYMKDINYINCGFRSGNRIPKFKSAVKCGLSTKEINTLKKHLLDEENCYEHN